jgi:hypothetical protein
MGHIAACHSHDARRRSRRLDGDATTRALDDGDDGDGTARDGGAAVRDDARHSRRGINDVPRKDRVS